MQVYAWDAPTTLARCIASALNKDAPDVMREQLKDGMSWGDRTKDESMIDFRKRAFEAKAARPDESDIEVYAMFVETWGSTALGFGGVGGQAMTPAYTTILMADSRYLLIYWGSRHAYTLDMMSGTFNSEAFQKDIAERRTRERSQRGYYVKKKAG
jgi:hypothetical protein